MPDTKTLEAARIEAMHTGDWTHYERERWEVERSKGPPK